MEKISKYLILLCVCFSSNPFIKSSWDRPRTPEQKMIQKYVARKKLSECFCIGSGLEDDSRFLKLLADCLSLAKWGKMGNVIWENFKFSISLAIVRCAVEWGWTICSIFGSFFIFMNSTLGKGNFPKKSNSTYYKKR